MKYCWNFLILAILALAGCDKEVDTSSTGGDSEFFITQRVECANGFEGQHCEIPVFKKFCGAYRVVDGSCPYGTPAKRMHRIVEFPGDFTKVKIYNKDFIEPIVAELDGWNLTIPAQRMQAKHNHFAGNPNLEVSGLGWIDLDQNRFVYKLNDGKWRYDLRYQM